MVGENTIAERSPLLPDRRNQADFFVCDIFDAAPKGDMASMQHPLFSLSTKPDRRVRRYEQNGNWLEIKPGHDGLATVHDRDVLIFCISQIMAALNRNEQVEQVVRFQAHDLLLATNRGTSGRGYEQLKAALERLQSTQIETNIITGNTETIDGFSLIDRFRIVRETREGRMQEVEVRLSDWVFNAIRAQEVLTLHRDYFRLRKPLERRMYEIARKHCGLKSEWRISLEILQRKCGSNSTAKEFRRLVRNIVKHDTEYNHIPDYSVRLEDQTVVFSSRGSVPPAPQEGDRIGSVSLKGETYEKARQIGNGWDVYYLEQEWRNWIASKKMPLPKNPDGAFLGFVKKWGEKKGRA